MARITRLSAEEILKRILENDEDSSNSDVIDEESDEELDSVLPSPSGSDNSSGGDESGGSDSEIGSSASRGRSLVAPSGKQWNLDVPPQTRTRSSNITVTASLTDKSRNIETEVDSFQLLMSDDIMQIIMDSTNKFAKSKVTNWHDVDDVELRAFLGLLILRGVCRAKRESVHNLWSTDSAFARPVFIATMSRERFKQLLRFLKFDDYETRADRVATDKLSAIRDMYEIFAANCRTSFQPGPYLTIDEQLVTFRGRCSFKMYISSKPGKYGLKVWALCDAKTSYCCNLQVYTGKEGNNPERNQAARVVRDLSAPFLDSGRNITMDNFFTGIQLADELLARRTTVVGTLRKNKRDIPAAFVDCKGRTIPSTMFAFSDQLTICSYCPKKNKAIVMLSSMHHDAAISEDHPAKKPDIILTYNETKSGVDNLDKLVREYSTKCSTRRWPLVLFLSWVDIAAYNSRHSHVQIPR